MTITFTSDEWEKHVSDIDKWRYKRDETMRVLLEEAIGSDETFKLFDKFNKLTPILNCPIQGMKFSIA